MDELEKDVKEIQDSSTETSSDQDVKEGKVTDRAIPYSRFKEKVDQVKDLEKQINKIRTESEASTAKTRAEMQSYYESEIARIQRDLSAKSNEDTFDSYLHDEDTSKISKAYDSKVSGLLQEINELKSTVKDLATTRETEVLRGQVTKLKDVYPSMDEEHVYAIKKIKPDWSLEECAEYSHNKWEEKLQSKFTKMMEEKKQAAKKPVFGPDGKLNIKPNERPKSISEAKKMMLQWAEQE